MSELLSARSSRLVWRWCIAYTALAPAERRERRRAELHSHLWESEAAGQPRGAVLRAAARGAGSDLGWATAHSLRRLLRAMASPTPYLALAAALPIQAAFAWNAASDHTANLARGSSELAAVACLLIAGSLYLRRRHR